MKGWRGFTLIEVMVALAVVAVLGLISYRGVAAAADTRQRLTDHNERWQDIVRLVRRLESDCLQMVARPGVVGGDVSLARLDEGRTTGLMLSFLRADGAGGQLRRNGYRYADGRIDLLRWPSSRNEDVPRADPLLDRVAGFELRFFRSNGQMTRQWPPAGATPGELPVAIDFDMEFIDAGHIRRLVALR